MILSLGHRAAGAVTIVSDNNYSHCSCRPLPLFTSCAPPQQSQRQSQSRRSTHDSCACMPALLPILSVASPDNHYNSHNCGDRRAYVSVCPFFFSLFCLPPYLFDNVCLSPTITIATIYLSHMYVRMPAPLLIGDSYILRLFNHVDDRDVAQITSIFHRSTFSSQAWFCILQHVTIFLAISVILPHASDVGMPCHPLALTSAIRCALIPRKIRRI